MALTGLMTGQPVPNSNQRGQVARNEDETQNSCSILATTEGTRGRQFQRKMGKTCQQPKLVMPWNDAYRLRGGPVHNGAILCPADGTVYIDLSPSMMT